MLVKKNSAATYILRRFILYFKIKLNFARPNFSMNLKNILLKNITYLFLVLSLHSFAQYSVSKEHFDLSFQGKANSHKWIFKGVGHSFFVVVEADSVKTEQYPNYISVKNQIVQCSAVPLPETNLDLAKLTLAQQKEGLSGYVDYEIDYFKNELHLQVQNLKKEWITINGKTWLLWCFDVPEQQATKKAAIPAKQQIYVSTICFNQVLDLNTPVLKGDSFTNAKALLKKLMATLKLANTAH